MKRSAELSQYFELPLPEQSNNTNIYWVFGLVRKFDCFPSDFRTSELIESLGNHGIGARPFFYSLHMQPCLVDYILNPEDDFTQSRWLTHNGFYLPSGLDLSTDDINYVCDTLLQICGSFNGL